MPDPTADRDARWTQRVTALEELFMHLQQSVQDLHEVLLEQRQRLERMEARLQRLAAGFETLTENVPTPPPDAVADRPPHY